MFRALLLLLFGVSVTLARPVYSDVRALGDAVKAEVADCDFKTGDAIPLPVITWGADVATVLGNEGVETKTDSSFGRRGLSFSLFRGDDFTEQVKKYMKCETPYLRGTLGMLAMALPLVNKDPRTRMKLVVQLSWSAGGDAIVASEDIRELSDLEGKTIALQRFGPHVVYLPWILDEAGLSPSDVNVLWLDNLTGAADTPVHAFRRGKADAAMVLGADAQDLVDDGKAGLSRKTQILSSTRYAKRVIADLYAVRNDYYEANKPAVRQFVRGIVEAQDSLKAALPGKKEPLPHALAVAGDIFEGYSARGLMEMVSSAELTGTKGNLDFLLSGAAPRNIESLSAELEAGLQALGLLKEPVRFELALFALSGLTKPEEKAEADDLKPNPIM